MPLQLYTLTSSVTTWAGNDDMHTCMRPEDDSTAPGALPGKIQAFVRGSEVLVWKAEDVILLRQRWRVVGGAIGALPLQPRQNASPGLPLLLSPEEATLLLEQGVLELREYGPLALKTLAEQQHFQQLRREDVQRQLVAYQEKRERERGQFAQPRRAKRRGRPKEEGAGWEGEERGGRQDDGSAKKARLHGETELESCEHAGGSSIQPVPDLSGDEAAQESGQQKSVDLSCRGDQRSLGTHEEEAGGGSLVRGQGSFSPLMCIHLADPRVGLCFTPAEWTFPHTELQALNYRVFRDLWGRGYHLTSGLKYGGDFLVYPGDPCLVHSHYVAIVLPWQQPIRDLVALGRLGAKVKKNVLLCSVDPQGAVQYCTLHWAGF